jgi:cephalosporin hydroxylase
MLELNAACGGPKDAEVIGIDIDIRAHNREAIEAHPMFRRITMIEGSSVSDAVISQVRAKAAGKRSVMVCLDSNHTHAHVLAELQAYAPLTSVGGYCVVFDTIVEHLPAANSGERPWGPGNNPMTAARAFLVDHPNFEADSNIDHKLLISVAPKGYLRRMR